MPSGALFPRACILSLVMFMTGSQPSAGRAAAPEDQLTDLTGSTNVVVTLTGRDNLANEFRYDVRVKNQSATPLETDSLVLVLDRITDLAGKDALDRVEVMGQDGETAERKPYFRVPVDGSALAPHGESKPAMVILKNAAYTIVFTPSFKVLGRSAPAPAKPPDPLQALIELLVRKGLITKEEGASIHNQAPPASPRP